MIEVQGVSHQFGTHRVLQQMTLDLRERRIGIVGRNGSGKTTFVRLLNGLLLPDQGQVLIDGLETWRSPKQIRRKVGFVFQNPDHQIVFPTVEEDLAFGLKNLRLEPKEIESRVSNILKRYDLEEFRHHPAHLLSGGQKQLLAIAAVLITAPKYIIFDEPTTLLDLRNRNQIRRILYDLEQPIIVASHDLELLKEFDRVLVFEQGQIVMDAVPAIALSYYVEQMS